MGLKRATDVLESADSDTLLIYIHHVLHTATWPAAASPLQVSKANVRTMTLLVKTALDATAQLLQHGSVDLTDLMPPLGAAKS